MLKVDLRQLERKRKLSIDETLKPGDAFWTEGDFEPAAPLTIRLDAQMAGDDIVLQGDVSGQVGTVCRRCLQPVTVDVDEELALVFRSGLSQVEAEAEEVYTLPEKGDVLDLTDAIREQVTLAVPQFVICEEACRGLCPRCGTNLNQAQCDCQPEVVEDRWAALRKLRAD